MFRPNDLAKVRGPTGMRVTVLEVLKEGQRNGVDVVNPIRVRNPWNQEVIYPESDLQMFHESCRATMEGEHRDALLMQARHKEADAKRPPRLSDEKRTALEKALKELPRDVRGHWMHGKKLYDRKEFEQEMGGGLGMLMLTIPEADADKIIAGSEEWISLGEMFGRSSGKCPYCGEDEFTVETNGKVVRIAGESCPYAEGFPVTEWELNVPSGKLVVANDLRSLFPLPNGDDDIESINTILGCHQMTLAYAEIGMSHASVGNSCPSVYRLPNKTGYSIGNIGGAKGSKRVAGICTDLWWYSICDKDEFDRRCVKFKEQIGEENFGEDIVTVEPGVYRFRHDYNVDRNAMKVVFTRFEKVREPDPVKDYLKNWEEVDVNPNAYVQAQVARWPTLYAGVNHKRDAKPWANMTETEQLNAWQRVADHVMCTIGGGTDWHEKGFPQAKVDSSILDIPCPKFRFQGHWYPFSAGYGGLFESESLSPGFARMAFEVLESVISFGTNVHFGTACREVNDTRKRMKLAVTRYRELVEKYPGVADPEYATWIADCDRAEKWVKAFDLGPRITETHLEHRARQIWLPEDAYAIEFDARKMGGSAGCGFAWHPNNPGCGGCWANPKDAQRWALPHHKPWPEWTGDPDDTNDNHDGMEAWQTNAGKSIPLLSVSRVVKLGVLAHTGDRLVEVAFDYGTEWMLDTTHRKGFKEFSDKLGIRVLTKDEYEAELPKAVAFYEAAEAEINALRTKEKSR